MSSGPITAVEVAARLGFSRSYVVKLAASGDLPYVRKMPGVRGAYLFDPGTVALWARQNRRVLKEAS
jgi:excisionase family DNA binding protein